MECVNLEAGVSPPAAQKRKSPAIDRERLAEQWRSRTVGPRAKSASAARRRRTGPAKPQANASAACAISGPTPVSTSGKKLANTAQGAALAGNPHGLCSPDSDVLQFGIKAKDRPPGSGSGERVASSEKYSALAVVKNWRILFSDVWEHEIEVHGERYRTHQHALQAGKFLAAGRPDVAARFGLASADPIALGSAEVAYGARRAVELDTDQQAAWAEVRGAWKDQIYAAKFAEGTDAAAALLATHDSLLVFDEPAGRGLAIRLLQRRAALRKGSEQA